MTHAAIAQILLAALCGAQGMATLAIDLNRTHATNPLWLRHARFHLVWQVVSYALLAVIEVALILAPGPLAKPRFYLAAVLASVPMAGCFTAFFLKNLYGGALSDPNGIPPIQLRVLGSQIHIDLNLAAEIAGLLLLIVAVALFRH